MSINIVCPGCGVDVPVNDVIEQQVAEKTRREMNQSLSQERQDLQKLKRDLKNRERLLETSTEDFDQRVAEALERERAALAVKLQKKARAAVEIEIADRDEQLAGLRSDLKLSQEAELKMRRRERDLQKKAEALEIEVERKLEEERSVIRDEALRQADEKHQLREAEKDKQISDMKTKIDELKRKSELTSQQLQGEVQEIALEETLRMNFPFDDIEPVGKGRNGADVGQQVVAANGSTAGRIIWESKRTKNWQKEWLPKLRDDQRECGAEVAVIVSETLPDGIHGIGLIDEVWVCRWDCVTGLAAALRNGLIEVSKATSASNGRSTKTEMLYDYFSGTDFRNRISGMVEAVASLRDDLHKEKAAMRRLWNKREKQLDRAIANMAGMYGDFQGIIGNEIPNLESLEPLGLETAQIPLATGA